MICEQTWCYETCLQTAGKQPRLTGPAVIQLWNMRDGPIWVKKCSHQGQMTGKQQQALQVKPQIANGPRPTFSRLESPRLQPGTAS